MSRDYLSDKNILVVSKPLAKMLGVGASIVMRRVQHWLEVNEADQKHDSHFHDGRWWTYNGYQKWTDDIEIYSKSTIKRLFTDLEKLHLLLSTCKYNKRKGDQTKWYSIDYDAYDRFVDLWRSHRCPMYLDGKQSAEYKAFIKAWQDQWTTVGIPTVVPPIDHSDTTNRPQWPHQWTTVGSPLPESPTDESTDESTESVKAPLLLPRHMINFEAETNNHTHAWVKRYEALLGQPYSASRSEMKQILEKQQTYSEEVFAEYAALRISSKPGCKLLFILQDLPNHVAAQKKGAQPPLQSSGKGSPAPEPQYTIRPEDVTVPEMWQTKKPQAAGE